MTRRLPSLSTLLAVAVTASASAPAAFAAFSPGDEGWYTAGGAARALDVMPPGPTTLTWIHPAGDGFVLSGTELLRANATDPQGIQSVQFWKDGVRLSVDSSAPYQHSLDTTAYPNGPAGFDVCGTDNLGNRTCGYPNHITGTINNSTPPPSNVVWQATHECVCFTEWSQYGFNQPQWFPDPEIRDPALDGVPRLEGTKALKLQVHDDDSRQGRHHAKVYKWWDYSASNPQFHSGRYTSNIYVDPTWSQRAGSWGVNLFQFKEEWNDGSFRQEAQWWISAEDNGSSLTGFINYGQSTGQGALRYRGIPAFQIPKGQWVKLAAEVRVGQYIEFFMNGNSLGRANHTSSTPVGPYRRAPRRWVFGTGNYGSNRGFVYVDDASYVR